MSAALTLLPALEPLRCAREDCAFPQGGRCARETEFDDPAATCPEIARAADAPIVVKPRSTYPPVEISDPAPWAGRHLPMDEARRLLQRSPARLFGVLGPHDAGKTSLLASFFLQLANGQRPEFPYRFASSRSLFGFSDLVQRAKRYRGEPGEQVVDHTPKTESADIGRLLHLGLRPDDEHDNRHVDVLLTDLPGEWITDWADVDEDVMDRRMPMLRRASGFVVVADASLLATPQARTAASNTAQLIQRVADLHQTNKSPGLSIVFSKVDLLLDGFQPPTLRDAQDQAAWGRYTRRLQAVWTAIEHAREVGLDVKVFPTSAFPGPLDKLQPVHVVEPFAHVLRCSDRRETWPTMVKEVPEGASCFQAMRRWRDAP